MSATTFANLGVPTPIVNALAAQGKTEAFEIQQGTLPDTLAGRDVLGRGRTGSGKTLAFAIPLVARISAAGGASRSGRPRGLVLAPTRELATQIAATVTPLAKSMGLSTTVIFGGVGQNPQVSALRSGVDIVIACPGRLDDLMKQGHARLDEVQLTVLDEADHMADLGFLPVVTRIMAQTPKDGQHLLFSATLDNGVDKLVKRFLTNEVRHSVDDETSPVAAMTHHLYEVGTVAEKNALVSVLASGLGRRIMFTRTKHQAKRLARTLTDAGIPARDLHGNLSQSQRDRNLADFSAGTARVLVATDIAARGVHVDDVELVVHVDPPAEHKAYVHRSGRTARAGSAGAVVTVMTSDQRRDTLALLRKAAISVSPTSVRADSDVVATLVGERAPYVKPAPPVDNSPQRPRRVRANGSAPAAAGSRTGSGRGNAGRRGGAGSFNRGGQGGAHGANGRGGQRSGARRTDAR